MTPRRTLLTACAVNLLAGVGLGAATSAGLVGIAQAQDQTATEPPPEVRTALTGALWAGSARLRFFGLDVYDAHLWVAPDFRASRYAQHGLMLELAYLRRLSGQSIAERSLQEMRRASPLTQTQAQDWLAAMQAAFPDVKAGDRLTGLHSPGVGARFWFNGQPRAVIRDPEFSRLFFGIWLAESTSEPQLRSALLARATP
jgi:F0F1-type ATP synthase membrane subunit c/vacuolar-type H+-ATPase subunit K